MFGARRQRPRSEGCSALRNSLPRRPCEKQGPITTSLCCDTRSELQLAQKHLPVVMGPGSSFAWPGRRGERADANFDSIVKGPSTIVIPGHRAAMGARNNIRFRVRCFASPRNDGGHEFGSLAARKRPNVSERAALKSQRAQGMPDARCTGGRCAARSTRVSNHRYTASAGIPCAVVLTVSFVLSSVTMLGCHRRSRTIPRP